MLDKWDDFTTEEIATFVSWLEVCDSEGIGDANEELENELLAIARKRGIQTYLYELAGRKQC